MIHNFCLAQLTIELGDDIVRCADDFSEIYLGEQAEITGGVPPYTYTWSCDTNFTVSTPRTIEDYVNDRHILNPLLENHDYANAVFYYTVTVTDNENNQAKDSIGVKQARITHNLGDVHYVDITEGDSVQFDYKSIEGGFAPYTYYWYPSDFLTDSANLNTWCKPEGTGNLQYSQYFVDAEGCISDTVLTYNIMTSPVSIEKVEDIYSKYRVLDNTIVFTRKNNSIMKYYFVNYSGSIIRVGTTHENEISIPHKEKNCMCIVFVDDTRIVIKL
jgi:hypothetical protein